jgi:hypothetical protein
MSMRLRPGDRPDERAVGRAIDRSSWVPARLASGPMRSDLGDMIRKLRSGEYRLYSRKKDPRTGKRRNLGTFRTLAAARRHEQAVQFFKRR